MLALPAHTVHLWWCRAERPDDIALAQLLPDEHRAAARFVFERDRHRHLATRWLLRRSLSRYAAVAAADWRFTANAWGKPFIASPLTPEPLFFNLSHSADVVLLAVARQPLLGVDVESHRPDDWLPIAQQVFATAEIEWLQAAPRAAQGDRFLRLWTLKEALVKALGQGLSAPLQQLVLQPQAADSQRRGDADLAAALHAAPATLEADLAAWRLVAGRLAPSGWPWALAVRDTQAQVCGPWPAA